MKKYGLKEVNPFEFCQGWSSWRVKRPRRAREIRISGQWRRASFLKIWRIWFMAPPDGETAMPSRNEEKGGSPLGGLRSD
jgi:hypothetical protein